AAFAFHIAYECFRSRQSSLSAAMHVASAAALGALGLAIGAIVHSLSVTTTTQHQRLLVIALLGWPVIVGLPAFLVAFAACGLLARPLRQDRRVHKDVV